MLNSLKKYLSLKLGIQSLKEELKQVKAQANYMAAFTNLTWPKQLELDKQVLQNALEKLKTEKGIEGFKTSIHKNDVMFSHHVYHNAQNPARAVFGYFNVGSLIAEKLHQIVTTNALPQHEILDFGSGYGRVSRFLPHYFSSSNITVSEVKEQALKFQNKALGFNTSMHTQNAESFKATGLDTIFALSVFTHLPQNSFEAWLKKLSESLNPGGALIFTFNNIETLPAAKHQDFKYIEYSEDSTFSFISDSLSNTNVYGSTYVSIAKLRMLIDSSKFEFKALKNQLIPNQESALILKR